MYRYGLPVTYPRFQIVKHAVKLYNLVMAWNVPVFDRKVGTFKPGIGNDRVKIAYPQLVAVFCLDQRQHKTCTCRRQLFNVILYVTFANAVRAAQTRLKTPVYTPQTRGSTGQ